MIDYRPSVEIAKFICCREAFVTVAYPDGQIPGRPPRWSYAFGNEAEEGDTITIEEAWPTLWEALNSRARIIAIRVHVPLLQHEGDALLSGFYQSGIDLLDGVADLLNAGVSRQKVFQHLQTYDDNAQGEVKDGLIDRRLREAYLGRFADYGDISQYPFYAGDPHKVAKEWKAFPENMKGE